MKALFGAASALFLNAFIATSAFGHPPAYGPDGLIPHSHTGDGTVITGNVVLQSHNDCPEATLPAILGMQTEGPCIRVLNGRPVDHHSSSAPRQEPVLISGASNHMMPVIRPVPVPMIPPVIVPVVRSVVQPANRQLMQRPIIKPLPSPQAIPVMAKPVSYVTPRVIIQGPAQVRPTPAVTPLGPQLVAQFDHEGEVLTVFNTNTVGFLGMTLIKILDRRGATKATWWAARGQCYTQMAYLTNACWSQQSYINRFQRELERAHPDVEGPGPRRSNNPCDHYTKLEAKLSGDDSGYCGY